MLSSGLCWNTHIPLAILALSPTVLATKPTNHISLFLNSYSFLLLSPLQSLKQILFLRSPCVSLLIQHLLSSLVLRLQNGPPQHNNIYSHNCNLALNTHHPQGQHKRAPMAREHQKLRPMQRRQSGTIYPLRRPCTRTPQPPARHTPGRNYLQHKSGHFQASPGQLRQSHTTLQP